MTPRPQGSFRGFFAKQGLAVFGSTGIYSPTYSMNTAILTFNSTGNVDSKISLTLGGNANSALSGNSTGVKAAASIFPSGGTIGITANSTAVVVPVLYIGAMALAANSTGVTIAGAQISTA